MTNCGDKKVPKNQVEPVWTIDDVCHFLQMGRTWVKERVRTGVIPSAMLGRRRRFDPEAVRVWWERQAGGSRR